MIVPLSDESTVGTFVKQTVIPRRRLLQAGGIALPMLESMQPRSLIASERSTEVPPRRMLAVCNNLGLLPGEFFPADSGSDYQLSPNLQQLSPHRSDFTVLNGVSHPEVDGGHPADNCFLTAAPHPGRGGFRNTISLDQLIAEQWGHKTRFPSLTLGVNVQQGLRSLSWTGQGVLIPCQQSASALFSRLFLTGSQREKEQRLNKLRQGGSILDLLADRARDLQRELPGNDRARLDQFYTGVRDLEKRMTMTREWETRPKPVVQAGVPIDPADPSAFMQKTRLMYEMSKLALETDSTRAITLLLDGVNTPALQWDGVTTSSGYHNLSHHGKREEKMAELRRIDLWHMKLLAELFANLKNITETDQTLLDRTTVLYGNNLGDANRHSTLNLPVLIAGGGFRHGQHLAFDRDHNYPLPNLFVSMLQRLGIETDRFATSTGTMRGLEMTS
jgi:Protein of unknown function (DUF1552)